MDARLTQTEINRASYNAVCREWADYRAKSRIGECIAEFERRLTENSDILDIGCGTGYPIASYLSKMGHRITGIDISENMIEEAKALRLKNADFFVQNIMEYRPQKQFDAVIAFDSIWHVEESRQKELFERISDMLKDGGWLLFTHGKERGTIRGEMFRKTFVYSALDGSEVKKILSDNRMEIVNWLEKYEEPSIGTRDLLVVARKGTEKTSP